MPPLILLLQILIAAVVLTLAAFFLLILAAVGVVLAAVAFVLHKLGWDRKLIAYAMDKAGARVHVSRPVVVRFGDAVGPDDARWAREDPDPAPEVLEIELKRPGTPPG